MPPQSSVVLRRTNARQRPTKQQGRKRDSHKLVLAELELICKRNNGILRPVDIVAYARNPKTALHTRFEWDATKAAHQYRLEQARHIVRVYVTIIETPDGKRIAERIYASVESERQHGNSYRLTTEILSDDEAREELLSQARRDMQSFRLKYRRLSELAAVLDAMEGVMQGKT